MGTKAFEIVEIGVDVPCCGIVFEAQKLGLCLHVGTTCELAIRVGLH